jgi:hypothetical protein
MQGLEVTGALPDFKKMAEAFPELSARLLGFLARKTMTDMYEKHLQGQDLEFHVSGFSKRGIPLSVAGRRAFGKPTRGGKHMMNYYVGKRAQSAAVYSAPVAIWEKRRKIISKTKGEVAGELAAWGATGLDVILKKITAFEDWK